MEQDRLVSLREAIAEYRESIGLAEGEPWSDPTMVQGYEHGTFKAYISGCHCDKCKAANAAEYQRQFADRHARLLADPTCVTHGRASTYNNWGCRCGPCETAHEAQKREVEGRRRRNRAMQRLLRGDDA